jgi:Protein-tyrosine-phosphatase
MTTEKSCHLGVDAYQGPGPGGVCEVTDLSRSRSGAAAPPPARMGRMTVRYRIAAVCTGNICRSPMAEAVLRRMLEQDALDRDVSVDSFGISGWHAGDGADPRAVAALHRRGYDITHRARRWHPGLFADRELVVALDSGHLAELCATAPTPQAAGRVRLLRSFDPDASAPDLDVPDPYHGGAAAFDHVLDLVEAGCRGLTGQLRDVLARS